MLCAVQCDNVSLDKIRFDNKPTHRDEGRTATTKKKESEENKTKTKHEVEIKEVSEH
jgi:hypothetical protein